MTNRLGLNISIGILTALLVAISFGQGGLVAAPTADTVSDYLDQISSANLVEVATVLVNQYGPRRSDTFSPYIDGNCTASSTVYPKSTIEMSVDYVQGLFAGMGYPAGSITIEALPGNAGQNIYVTKVGSAYPNVFIEFSATRHSGRIARRRRQCLRFNGCY